MVSRIVLRVTAAVPAAVKAGVRVSKGQYLGRAVGRQGSIVVSPVDGVVEDVLFLAEQQASVVVLAAIGQSAMVNAAG